MANKYVNSLPVDSVGMEVDVTFLMNYPVILAACPALAVVHHSEEEEVLENQFLVHSQVVVQVVELYLDRQGTPIPLEQPRH